MDSEKLKIILDKHQKWLKNEEGGEQANLSFANLSSADLSSANLSFANLDKKYIVISCIGSRKDSTTYCFDDDKIWCGCFTGNLEEFESKVNEKHKNNPQYLKEYCGAITYIRGLK